MAGDERKDITQGDICLLIDVLLYIHSKWARNYCKWVTYACEWLTYAYEWEPDGYEWMQDACEWKPEGYKWTQDGYEWMMDAREWVTYAGKWVIWATKLAEKEIGCLERFSSKLSVVNSFSRFCIKPFLTLIIIQFIAGDNCGMTATLIIIM